MVYFDDLNRRSISTVGHGKIFQSGNETGLDDANHDPQGIFISARMGELRKGGRQGRQIADASCLDITPTILHEFGLAVPEDLSGRIIDIDEVASASEAIRPILCSGGDDKSQPAPNRQVKGYTCEEEEIIKKRLMELGYL